MTDEENPELTAEDFAAMRPARSALPAKVFENLIAENKRRVGERGRGKKPAKVSLTLRVEPEVLSAWRASGEGWQGRARDVLTREAPKAKRRA